MTEMALPGAPVETQTPQVDYFGFSNTTRFTLPDGVSWFEIKSMNEGEKARFQQKTQKDLVLERQSGNARMKLDQASERHELIRTCVVDWNLSRNGVPVPFNGTHLNDFLKLADPTIVEKLEVAVRKANPWLLAEMSVEDIDREIENLQEMRKVAEEREAGNAS